MVRSGCRPAPVLAALTALLLACSPAKQAPPPRLPTVQSEVVTAQPFREEIETISSLEAIEEVQLAAQAGGRILQLRVRQGDLVRRGELLLVLDQTQARAEVARLQAEVATNLLNYRRYETLVRQGAASAFQRDEFRQRWISARQELIERQADLAFRDLRSPIDGMVGDVKVKQGDVIQAGAPFTSVIRNDRLLARLDVPAVYSDRLRPGLPVIVMDPQGLRPIARSRISSIDPSVLEPSQSLLVKAPLENPSGVLRDGLRLRTRLLLEERQQLAVPFQAVSQFAGQSFVFVIGDGNVALQTPVRLGPLQRNRYPVLQGLQAGDRVITSNITALRHRSPIRLAGSPERRAAGAVSP